MTDLQPSKESPEHENNHVTGDNLLLLMDLPLASSVLIVGEKLASWRLVFRNADHSERLSTPAGASVAYGLILYHSDSADSRRMFDYDMRRARQLLASNGSILLFAENFYTPKRLKWLLRGRLDMFGKKPRYSRSGYREALERAGFESTHCFLPLPGLIRSEELVLAGSKMLELPHCRHPLLHLAHRLAGCLALAEGFVILGGPNSLGSSYPLQAVNEVIARHLKIPVASCVVERLDIRLRGAFVLFLTETHTGRCFIVRLVADCNLDEIVGKNHAFLGYLRTGAGLTAALMDKLPRPISRMEHEGSIVYVETMVAGMLAWKVNRGRLRPRIYNEAVDFLRQVHHASRQHSTLSAETLRTLFSDDFARLTNGTVLAPEFRERVAALLNALRDRLIGSEMDLVVSHGDFGYGNILVDPHHGDMQGVIDWDTGKANDFPGVDLINLLVQKERVETGCAVLPAFAALVGGGIAERVSCDYRSALTMFGIAEELHSCIVHLGFIRYLARSARYPKLFQQEHKEDFRQTLDLLLEHAPL